MRAPYGDAEKLVLAECLEHMFSIKYSEGQGWHDGKIKNMVRL